MYSRRIALATLLGSTVLRSDARGPFFGQILRPGARMKITSDAGNRTIALRLITAGKVHLPSGKLLSAGIMELNQARSIPIKIKAGSYAVELLVGEHPERGALVTAAVLRLAAGAPTGWEPADCGYNLPGCPFSSYGHDACFADAEAASLWRQLKKSPQDLSQVLQEIETAQKQNLETRRAEFAESILTDDNAINLIAYKPGMEEGQLTNWLGLNRAGQVVAVLTDFGMHDDVVWPYGRVTL